MPSNEPTNSYETIEPLHQLDFLELRKESDRGLVLIFSEYINEFLKRILAFEVYKKTKNKTIVDDLLDDSRSLGTFHSRLLAAHGFGILDKRAYLTINFIRKIRNIYAHENTIVSLDSPNFEPLILELRKIFIAEWISKNKEKHTKDTPRQLFGIVSSMTIAFLYGLRNGKLSNHFGKNIDEQVNPGLANFWVPL